MSQAPQFACVISDSPQRAPALASRARRMAAILMAGAFVAAGASGCASAGPYNPARLPLAQLGQVQQICHSVLGIPNGVGLAADCVANLSDSALALDQGHAMQDARRACLDKGLRPGQTALSECELSTTSTPLAPAAMGALRIDTSSLQPPAKSYYYASFDEVRRREQTACARLGYDPIDKSFTTCVASLDAALYASDHPMQ